MDERIGFGLSNPVGTWVVLDMCLCFGCGGWCYVCVRCESGLSV